LAPFFYFPDNFSPDQRLVNYYLSGTYKFKTRHINFRHSCEGSGPASRNLNTTARETPDSAGMTG